MQRLGRLEHLTSVRTVDGKKCLADRQLQLYRPAPYSVECGLVPSDGDWFALAKRPQAVAGGDLVGCKRAFNMTTLLFAA